MKDSSEWSIRMTHQNNQSELPKTENQNQELKLRTKTQNQNQEPKPRTKTKNQNQEQKPRTKTKIQL